MNKLCIGLLALLVSVSLSAAETATNFKEGVHFQRLSTPLPTESTDKIEVLELFWYGCPHCHEIEPQVEHWLASKADDVTFIRMPAIFSTRWEVLARAFYTAEYLGVLDKMHKPLFEALHVKKRKLTDEDSLAKFFAEQGINEKEFRDTYRSFAVVTSVNRAKQMTRRYGIDGVPAIIVNGTYRTGARLAGTNEKIFEVVEHLVTQERQAMVKQAPISADDKQAPPGTTTAADVVAEPK